ncbi:transporter (CPA2 family) [Streptomyces sp. BK208]|uniref:cation:proton antiporter n=1 Tax=Streptomyces sp. BK208 TaxID=2512150 RepID=UPI0010F019A8|nr:cation:proton antiporter [Streptomyces sp. BK208]TDT23056.1 transporter (CPA2 family) [Streptomyces sp. BK208]
MSVLHLLAVLVTVLAAARGGRAVARRLRQPEVVGEITLGLLAGPAVLAFFGRPAFDAVLPQPVLGDLKLVGEAGLVLFLVGLAHRLQTAARPGRRAVAWVSAGALLLPLLCGALFAGWIVLREDTAVRGHAPAASFVLMVAVTLSISAVPVMARMIAERRMHRSVTGALTLTSAVVIDTLGWLLLTLALCLSSGSPAGFLRSLLALAAAAAGAWALRAVMLTPAARRLGERAPGAAAAALGTAAIGVALSAEHMGMTAIVGAAAVGMAVPRGGSSPWAPAVASVSRAGQALVPVFFVVTGVTVFGDSRGAAGWPLFALAIALGAAGKIGGGYLGARLGGRSPRSSRQVAVLMNTRGLTELVMLQAGLESGVLTPALTRVLVVMALVTTAMTGPLLRLLDRGPHGPASAIPPASAAPVVPAQPAARLKGAVPAGR